MPLILASTSPRRKELLALLGHPFDVCAPTFVEQLQSGRPAEEQAREFALRKAGSCAEQFPNELVLGSDTVIALDEAALGKPRDRADAKAMLHRLSGREHRVCTAVALVCIRRAIRDVRIATVTVCMKPWDDARIESYLRTGESLGKAGAYSIQGSAAVLIERIDGDFTAAVGLPLRLVHELLTAHGIDPVVDIRRLYHAKPYPNWSRFPS